MNFRLVHKCYCCWGSARPRLHSVTWRGLWDPVGLRRFSRKRMDCWRIYWIRCHQTRTNSAHKWPDRSPPSLNALLRDLLILSHDLRDLRLLPPGWPSADQLMTACSTEVSMSILKEDCRVKDLLVWGSAGSRGDVQRHQAKRWLPLSQHFLSRLRSPNNATTDRRLRCDTNVTCCHLTINAVRWMLNHMGIVDRKDSIWKGTSGRSPRLCTIVVNLHLLAWGG